jgi:CheY-like chemotaxis protein
MGKKILLADDSITIQKVIELTFSDEDFEVVTVGNGRLAIEKVQEVRPDVVLCDIIMPEKDGYEVCDFIKKNPNFSNIPVLLLTGAFEPFDQERAARVGCDGFLAKPFEPQTLIAKVRDLLSQAAARHTARPAAATPPAPPSPASLFTGAPEEPVFPRAVPPPPAPPPPQAVSEPPSFIPEEPFQDSAPLFEPELSPEPSLDEGSEASAEFFGAAEVIDAAPEDLVSITPEESADLVAPAPPDLGATIAFATAPPWARPEAEPQATVEVPLETRAQAGVESQLAGPDSPLFEEVFEETLSEPLARFEAPTPFEPPPPAVVEPRPAPAAPSPPVVVEPPPPDVVAAPAPPPPAAEARTVPPAAPASEASFADTFSPGREEPSEAAGVGVPADQVAQIAQRVVAQISEKVIREVAWEVIPELAEALIKKEIERLKAELQQT